MSAPAQRIVDLRSDTVTKPTPEMRLAMFEANVGDDVLGDDETVKVLEQTAAEMFGKEAALFVPSGTMGNLICCMVHCQQRGSELIIGSDNHIHFYEQGGIAQLGGIHSRVIPSQPNGTIELSAIESCIRTNDVHFPTSKLICLETTHNRCGGRILSLEYIQSVGALARKHNLKLHIDGARIMNAIKGLNISPAEYVAAADSVSICLSKGLAAPIGSVIVGTQEFIQSARRVRKVLGGGMRQVGVIAAPALKALTTMADRLVEDHKNAKELAIGISKISGLYVDLSAVETNIVFATIDSSLCTGPELAAALKPRGVWAMALGPTKIRFVLHYHITHGDVVHALTVLDEVVSELRATKAASVLSASAVSTSQVASITY